METEAWDRLKRCNEHLEKELEAVLRSAPPVQEYVGVTCKSEAWLRGQPTLQRLILTCLCVA